MASDQGVGGSNPSEGTTTRRAHILSIGSELILGHLTDTNATFLAQELAALGIELLHVTQVGDDLPRLTATLRHAAAAADLVICTGGIGPTADDLTREAIAAWAGQQPAVDSDLLTTVRGFFAARGQAMPERNAKQAWLIPAATALPNPVGTAPGWFVEQDDRLVVAMPGVPREMVRMWREQAAPRIAARVPARVIRGVTYKTLGIGESAAEQILAELVRQTNPIVATYAKDDGVQVRVTAVAAAPDAAERLREATAAMVRDRLGAYIYGEDATSLPAALLALMRQRGLQLGVAEWGSGGRFAALLAADPAAGDRLLGVTVQLPAQDARPPAAANLAREAMAAFAVPLGLGLVLIVTGADGDVLSGTVEVALAGARNVTERFQVRGVYDETQRRAALSAADVLRRALLEAETSKLDG